LAGEDDDDGVWVRECRGGCAKNRWTQRLILMPLTSTLH